MISFRQVLISALLMTAIAFSGWSIFLSNQNRAITTTDASSTQPDGFMEGVTATFMNKEGTPALKVDAPKLIHYANNDTTEFVTPHVIIFRHATEPWHIHANHAKTLQGLTEINFWDDVVIHHAADKDNPLTTIKTSTLTIFPDQQVAKTAEAITVTQPDTTVYAVGMLANWDQGTVKLLSQAREEYVPHS